MTSDGSAVDANVDADLLINILINVVDSNSSKLKEPSLDSQDDVSNVVTET